MFFQLCIPNGSYLIRWFICLEQGVFIQIISISWTRLITACHNIWWHGEGMYVVFDNLSNLCFYISNEEIYITTCMLVANNAQSVLDKHKIVLYGRKHSIWLVHTLRFTILSNVFQAERDGSNEYSDYQPGSLNTTDQLIKDLDNFDIVFHIGDLPYANGYISQWDQFTAQVQPITSTVPYMIARFAPLRLNNYKCVGHTHTRGLQ